VRITNKVMVKGYLSNLRTNLEEMKKKQEQLSSGHQVQRPSDDPFRVARTMELTASIGMNERYAKNIDEGIGWLYTTDSALGQIGDALQTIREKTVEGGNGAYGLEEKLAIAKHLRELKDHIVQVGNTAYDGRFVFSGDKTTESAFKTDENGNVTYQGTSRGLIKEMSPGVTMNVGTTGDSFKINVLDKNEWAGKTIDFNINGTNSSIILTNFTDNPTLSELVSDINSKISENTDLNGKISVNASGTDSLKFNIINSTDNISIENSSTADLGALEGTQISSTNNTVKPKTIEENLFKTLDDIIKKLENNENPGDKLNKLDDQINNILRTRSEVGAKQKRLEDMMDKNESETFNMTELLAKTYDIDIAQVLMESKVMESIYTASLNVGARILQPSLLDFLR
jgi:flagellar hook-associated protein 3